MNPLNDDELNELLRRAKAERPQTSEAFDVRLMRAYQDQTGSPPLWRRLWGERLSRQAFGLRNVLAAIVLILIGVATDRILLAAHSVRDTRKEAPAVVERVVYKDCPGSSQGPGLTFDDLPPVREIKPRVVRSKRDDQ